jgi:ABC-type transport system substrate-binding protein
MTSDPSRGSLAQDWGSEAALSGDGANFSMYMNPTLDAVLDSATGTFDIAKARGHYRRALEILIADAPAVWLYEAKGSGAIHRRVITKPMRADAWWAHLDEWSIDPTMAIARDSIGLRAIAP